MAEKDLFINLSLSSSVGTGHLKEACLTIMLEIVLLSIYGSMPLNVVSTSGNSGTERY